MDYPDGLGPWLAPYRAHMGKPGCSHLEPTGADDGTQLGLQQVFIWLTYLSACITLFYSNPLNTNITFNPLSLSWTILVMSDSWRFYGPSFALRKRLSMNFLFFFFLFCLIIYCCWHITARQKQHLRIYNSLVNVLWSTISMCPF